MSQSPLFSVVIPTYNRADLLREALESVDRQACREFELIVVDDGSTEDLSSVVAEYLGRAKFLRQENAGPSAARNYGVQAANGEYVAFLDSDDLWFPWTLSVYRQILSDHGRPAFIAGCPHLFRERQELSLVENARLQSLPFPDYLRSGDTWRWFGVSSFVIRRQTLIDCGGFTSSLRFAEDADLAMTLGTVPGFVQVISPATFGYRQGSSDQLTREWKSQLPAARRMIESECNLRYPGAQERAIERRRIICRHVKPVAITLLREREFTAAWKLYLSMLPWTFRLRQWRFLFGFPAWAMWRQALGHRGEPVLR
jgi:hypothetical protein